MIRISTDVPARYELLDATRQYVIIEVNDQTRLMEREYLQTQKSITIPFKERVLSVSMVR